MGLKLHYAKKYEVKWNLGGDFNYMQDGLNCFLYDLSGGFDSYVGDNVDYTEEFEINKDTVRDMIESLENYNDSELPDQLIKEGYTISDVRNLLIEALENSDPNNEEVVFAWF